jgi:lipopolysaccharide/colanic/teichoic acid biosynthesis glycosyltransferase
MEQGVQFNNTTPTRGATAAQVTFASDPESSLEFCVDQKSYEDFCCQESLIHPALRVPPKASITCEFFIRAFDIVGSLVILILSSPVMLVVSAIIKIFSPGTILYRQERVGKGGRTFTLYKFRTMIENAEQHIGPVWASKNDSRVTPVGRILRRMRLDELPQLVNVLRGNMSLVGPRPERPFFVRRHKALQGIRLMVKPGITGLAQIRSYYNLKPERKLKYDYLYIQKRSLLLNAYILLQTIPVLFTKKGW